VSSEESISAEAEPLARQTRPENVDRAWQGGCDITSREATTMNLKKMMTPAALAMALAFGTAGAASAQDRRDNRGHSQDNARAQNSQPQRGRTEQAVPRNFNAAPRTFTTQPRQDIRRDDRSRGFDNRGFDRGFRAPIVRGRDYSPRFVYPRAYRPGFSLGFGVFFGSPLPYRYAYPAYGYRDVAPGVAYGAYGAISFALDPGDAAVYVDGNYVGVARGFDDTMQPLSLTAGTHRIELNAPGYEPVAFDVNVAPGQLIPYEGSLQPAY
jgi:PEGA domain